MNTLIVQLSQMFTQLIKREFGNQYHMQCQSQSDLKQKENYQKFASVSSPLSRLEREFALKILSCLKGSG